MSRSLPWHVASTCCKRVRCAAVDAPCVQRRLRRGLCRGPRLQKRFATQLGGEEVAEPHDGGSTLVLPKYPPQTLTPDTLHDKKQRTRRTASCDVLKMSSKGGKLFSAEAAALSSAASCSA